MSRVGAGHSEATAEQEQGQSRAWAGPEQGLSRAWAGPEQGQSKVIIGLEHVKIGSREVKSKGRAEQDWCLGVCSWQIFSAYSIVCGQDQEPTLDWSTW